MTESVAWSEVGPLELHRETVRPDWIDYNGHMNVAYYVLAFDHGSDRLFDLLGIGVDYRRRTDCSVFVLEAHVTYDRELKLGEPLRVATQLLDCDAKRLQCIHTMYHAEDGFLAATNELIFLHVDLRDRRAAPFPAEAQARIGRLYDAHRGLPRPPQAGRVIGIRRKG